MDFKQYSWIGAIGLIIGIITRKMYETKIGFPNISSSSIFEINSLLLGVSVSILVILIASAAVNNSEINDEAIYRAVRMQVKSKKRLLIFARTEFALIVKVGWQSFYIYLIIGWLIYVLTDNLWHSLIWSFASIANSIPNHREYKKIVMTEESINKVLGVNDERNGIPVAILFSALCYANIFFPTIHQSFGGGRPVPIVIESLSLNPGKSIPKELLDKNIQLIYVSGDYAAIRKDANSKISIIRIGDINYFSPIIGDSSLQDGASLIKLKNSATNNSARHEENMNSDSMLQNKQTVSDSLQL